jgi:hypothetical protein
LGYHRQVLPLHGGTVQGDEVHQQARVENTFFRYKTIISPRLRARHPESQQTEAIIACNILNRMIALGRPESFAIAD